MTVDVFKRRCAFDIAVDFWKNAPPFQVTGFVLAHGQFKPNVCVHYSILKQKGEDHA